MKRVCMLLTGLAVALAALTASPPTAEAQAQDRWYLLVLIDASGSMTMRRADNRSRLDAAKTLSIERIIREARTLETSSTGDSLLRVAVYTFRGAQTFEHTDGFVDPNDAMDAIEALSIASGNTPLAANMCDAVDRLVEQQDATIRLLQVSSDGVENTTAPHPCRGDGIESIIPVPSFTPGSWQNLVYLKLTNPGGAIPAILHADLLFDWDPVIGEASGAASGDAPAAAALPRTASGDRPPTLEEFFHHVTRDTGGELRLVADSAPLPVTGDLNDDHCVDISDALMVVERFGEPALAGHGRFDLDRNGVIGFGDYKLALAGIGGGCGTPNPYRPMAPVSCNGSNHLVIEGRSIAATGNAIEVRGSCRVTIRNSLIVAGEHAFDVSGSAQVIVEDSYVVAGRAVLDLHGSARISASGSLFRGPTDVRGAWAFDDLGDNDWR